MLFGRSAFQLPDPDVQPGRVGGGVLALALAHLQFGPDHIKHLAWILMLSCG